MFMSRFHVCLLAAASAAMLNATTPGMAEDISVLTVCPEGHEEGEETKLTLEDLEAMGADSFATTTIWTDGKVEFEGVKLSRLLEELEITDGMLELIAANDYLIEIPVDEAMEDPGLIAYRMNGELMSSRDKGPLWLVFPFDDDVKYQSEVYYARSIWQVDRIKVVNE